MAQPFRVIDGDAPGRDWGGWDEQGNVDLPGTLTVDTVQGSGSSTPELTTVRFPAMVEFEAAVSLDQAVTIGDNLTVTGYLAAGSGQSDGTWNLWAAQSNALNIGTAGGGIAVAEGANARMGLATLVAGAATVANTSVTANSRIFLTTQAPGGTPGWVHVSARVAGTSFTITSSSGTDTSSVAYLIVEPAS